MVSGRDETKETAIREKLGIGLPPGREQIPSLKLRLDNGLELERDSLISEVQRVSFSSGSIINGYENERSMTDLLDGIGRDLDCMMGSIRSYRDLRERLR